MKQHAYIAAAAVGGAAPSLLTLAIDLMKPGGKWPDATFLVGMALMSILGAVVGWVCQEKKLHQAFLLGIGLPAMINSGAGASSSGKNTTATTESHQTWSLMGSAYAAEPPTNRPPEPPTPTMTATNVISVVPNALCKDANVLFKDAKGRTIGTSLLSSVNKTNLVVPPETATVWFTADDFKAKHLQWSGQNPSAPVTVEMKAERSKWAGFRRSLGFRDVKQYELELYRK